MLLFPAKERLKLSFRLKCIFTQGYLRDMTLFSKAKIKNNYIISQVRIVIYSGFNGALKTQKCHKLN